MSNKLIEYFSRISPLSNEEVRAIEKSMSPKNFKKGAVLLKEGEVSVDTYLMRDTFRSLQLSVPKREQCNGYI